MPQSAPAHRDVIVQLPPVKLDDNRPLDPAAREGNRRSDANPVEHSPKREHMSLINSADICLPYWTFSARASPSRPRCSRYCLRYASHQACQTAGHSSCSPLAPHLHRAASM
eukprot:4791471-Pyramimonas_sp.AAC.1